jgi:ATP-dependent Lhr-like helicase
LQAIRPVLELQRAWSIIPAPDELLIETTTTKWGAHAFLFPFHGRLVHEGLASVLAHRIAAERPVTITATVNDYGIDILTPEPLDLDEAAWRRLLSVDNLLPDLLTCLNSSELARRRFRDVARIAGLIHPGYPGGSTRGAKPARHLQASSELFFDVFAEFDPANLLLDQARREVLEEQLEIARLRSALETLRTHRIVLRDPGTLTPLSFPLWAESLRAQHVSSESWQDRVERMVVRLADRAAEGGAP